MIYNDILETLGNTPLIKLTNFTKHFKIAADIYLKLESKNPAGSVKDRAALSMLNNLLKENKINKDTTIVEATSGNTGISLAMVCARLRLKLVIFMPENMSLERRLLMSAYGAKLILTPKENGMTGAINAANEYIKNNHNSHLIDQFNNKNNVLAHYLATGPEIYNDLPNITHFMAGIGTGGTITGVAKFLKEKNKEIKIIGAEPANSPFLTKGYKGIHKIEGIGAGFKPSILDTSLIDEIYQITDDEAYQMAKLFPQLEGILVGISTGASLSLALKTNLRKGDKVVIINPDSGERYLSTTLYK